jgi:hypothetical protein
MKLTQLFEEVESRKEMVVFANSQASGITSSSSGVFWNTGTNAVFNPDTKRVRITSVTRLLGVYLKEKFFEIPVKDFFETMKMSKQEIKIVDGAIDKYLSAIEKAQKFGQTALVEKMKDDIEIIKKETLALTGGVKEYLTEEQVEKLLEKSSKHIEVTYIKNFARPIPDTLLESKEKLDQHKVFDDYVIFHYDPKKKNTDLTKKEKERKKDPILFGVIKGARNLYYIGDWVDEHCNLTLKEALTIIGGETKKI